MCTFYSTLPKQSKSTGLKKKNLVLSMKPCKDEKTFYRFRLLAFSSDGKNDRDFPWIQRFMHVKWGVHPEKGHPMIVDSITCPVMFTSKEAVIALARCVMLLISTLFASKSPVGKIVKLQR